MIMFSESSKFPDAKILRNSNKNFTLIEQLRQSINFCENNQIHVYNRSSIFFDQSLPKPVIKQLKNNNYSIKEFGNDGALISWEKRAKTMVNELDYCINSINYYGTYTDKEYVYCDFPLPDNFIKELKNKNYKIEQKEVFMGNFVYPFDVYKISW